MRSGVTDGLVCVSDEFVDLYGKILNDEGLAVSTKGRFLAISSSCPSRPELSHLYNHLSHARTAVLQAVYKKHGETLRKVCEERSDSKSNIPPTYTINIPFRARFTHRRSTVSLTPVAALRTGP